MSKVVGIILERIEAVEATIRELLVERAELRAGAELFDSNVKIEDIKLVIGNAPVLKKTKAADTIALGNNADKIVRRKPGRKASSRIAVAGSILFGERIKEEDSARLVVKSFLPHLIKTGYIIPHGSFYLATPKGKKFVKAYAGTGLKFFVDSFDELLSEANFQFTRKEELV